MRLKRYQPKYANTEKKRRVFPTSALIVYLLIAVTLTTGVSFSSYTTTASGSDSARVAKFSMAAATVSGQSGELKLDAENISASYVFTVSSNSETAVTYNVVVSLPKALPRNVTMKLDSRMGTASGNTYTFSGAGSFTPGSKTNSHKLEFSVPSKDKLEEDGILNDITITVNAQQAN